MPILLDASNEQRYPLNRPIILPVFRAGFLEPEWDVRAMVKPNDHGNADFTIAKIPDLRALGSAAQRSIISNKSDFSRKSAKKHANSFSTKLQSTARFG